MSWRPDALWVSQGATDRPLTPRSTAAAERGVQPLPLCDGGGWEGVRCHGGRTLHGPSQGAADRPLTHAMLRRAKRCAHPLPPRGEGRGLQHLPLTHAIHPAGSEWRPLSRQGRGRRHSRPTSSPLGRGGWFPVCPPAPLPLVGEGAAFRSLGRMARVRGRCPSR